MRWLAVVACLAACGGGSGGGGSAYMFDQATVREIHLTIPPDSWTHIDAEAVPGEPACRTTVWERSYYTGGLEFEGQTFDGVGIRVKGGCGTSRHLDQKASFVVNLEWDDPAVPGCPPRRRLHGLKHLTLNNLVQDATYLHEALGYALYRKQGVPAPRTAYVKVFVNGEYFGLYLLLETIDRQFLENWFADENGMMYENGRPYCDLVPGNGGPGGCFTMEFQPNACHEAVPGEDPRDFGLLDQLIGQLQTVPYSQGALPALGDVFLPEHYLGGWAVSSVIHHVDSFHTGTNNNYRVYHEPTLDRWSLIQEGLDFSMFTDSGDEVFAGVADLDVRCLSDPECTRAYVSAVERARDAWSDPATVAEAQRLHDLIWPLIQSDPRREYVYDGEPYTTDAQFLAAYQRLIDWIPARKTQIDGQLAAHGF